MIRELMRKLLNGNADRLDDAKERELGEARRRALSLEARVKILDDRAQIEGRPWRR